MQSLFLVQLEYIKKRRLSADVIGRNNEDDLRRWSSDVDSPWSPGALPTASRFDNFNYQYVLCTLLWCCCVKFIVVLIVVAVDFQNMVCLYLYNPLGNLNSGC